VKALLSGLILVLCFTAVSPLSARKKPSHHASPLHQQTRPDQIEAATRLQIFLDRANFAPGAINGHYNDFTWKALSLYRQSRGEPAPSPPPHPEKAPDLTGIDLASVGTAFVDYTVTDADLQNIGPVPGGVPAQAKLKFLPYRDAAEAIAEKFHCDVHFLHQLNPGKTFKAGDQLKVPNVEPFEFTEVKDLKPGSEMNSEVANDLPNDSDSNDQKPDPPKTTESPSVATSSVKIDTKTNILTVLEGDRVMASYPVTIGSAQTASPIGEWKVQRVVKLPRFRHDEAMLKYGRRSGNFHMLPPGPNSPVGVVWIALNKKGIGIHGTNEPETIGHSVSHGCVRLANWDAVRLAQRIKSGVPVSIY